MKKMTINNVLGVTLTITALMGCSTLYEYNNYLQKISEKLDAINVLESATIMTDTGLIVSDQLGNDYLVDNMVTSIPMESMPDMYDGEYNMAMPLNSQSITYLDPEIAVRTVPKSVHKVTLPNGATFCLGESIGSVSGKLGGTTMIWEKSHSYEEGFYDEGKGIVGFVGPYTLKANFQTDSWGGYKVYYNSTYGIKLFANDDGTVYAIEVAEDYIFTPYF